MDSVVVMDDCGTDQSIVVSSIVEGGDIIQPLTERILVELLQNQFLIQMGKRFTQLDT